MSINFTTAFTQLGRILHLSYLLTPYESTLPNAFLEIFNQYTTSLQSVGSSVQSQADSSTRTASGMMGFASGAATATVQQTVQNDPTAASQAGSLQSALQEWIRQMNLQSVTVQANAITVSSAQLPNSVGTGVVVTTNKRGDGLVQENSVGEILRLVCTADSYTGGRTVGQEQFGLTGQAVTSTSVWDYDYPTGSGAATSVTAVSASAYASSTANLLTNGDFANWSATSSTATLNNWTLGGASAWGTDLEQNTTEPLTGLYCLAFLPGTNVNSIVYQEFGSSAGTNPTPNGLQSYTVVVWLRNNVAAITGGVLTLELTDGSGNVTNDAQGNPNSYAISLTAINGTYTAYSATFRLNSTPPATIFLRFHMTTPLTGGQVLAASVAYAPVTAMYTGGPAFNVFSNPVTPFVGGDGWNITVGNNYGGTSYLGTFQTGFQRLFSMSSLNLLLPSSNSPTISNTLISAA